MSFERSNYEKMRSIPEIVDAVEVNLRNSSGSANARCLPKLALILSKAIPALSLEARSALAAAGAYLDRGESEEADFWIQEWSKRIDVPEKPSAIAAANRIVWIALNRNTSFTDYSVEFTIQTAQDAGLDIETIANGVANIMKSIDCDS